MYKRKERADKACLRYGDNILSRKYIPMSNELKIKNLQEKHSWEKKHQVVGCYMELSSLQKTADVCKVGTATISAWKKQDWWPEVEARILREKALEHDGKLSKIIDKALSIVEDRLQNGEQVLNNKTGTLVSKPVSLRDTTNTLSALSARQKNVRNELSGVSEEKASVKETLALLAKEFALMNKSLGKRKPEIIDLEDVDALHDPAISVQEMQSGEPEDTAETSNSEQNSEILSSDNMFQVRTN